MEAGNSITARTHAEFLNTVMGTNYDAWMRCTYPISDDFVMWFIRLDGRESSMGWTNTLVSQDKIVETYTGDPNKRIDTHKTTDYPKKRAVFNIVNSGGRRKYIFKGVFKFSFKESNNDKRIWYKVSEQYSF